MCNYSVSRSGWLAVWSFIGMAFICGMYGAQGQNADEMTRGSLIAEATPIPVAVIATEILSGTPLVADGVFVVRIHVTSNTTGYSPAMARLRVHYPATSVSYLSATAGGLGDLLIGPEEGSGADTYRDITTYGVMANADPTPVIFDVTFQVLSNPATPFSISVGDDPDSTICLIKAGVAHNIAMDHVYDNAATQNLEAVTPTATPSPTPTPCSQIGAAITIPKEGDRVSGNRLHVEADLGRGNISDVMMTRFQYRLPSLTGTWTDIPAASLNHPNPDLDHPWFLYWDVTALPEQSCDLRAVVYDSCGIPDYDPPFITVIIDHHQPDVVGTADTEGRITQETLLTTTDTNTAGSGQDDGPLSVELGIPGEVLDSPTTCSITWKNTSGEEYTVAGKQGVYGMMDVNLGSGQTTFSQPVRIEFAYPDADQNGIVDGTDVMEMTLSVYYFDELTNQMTEIPGSTVDATANKVSVEVSHFTVFALFGQPAATVHDWTQLQ